MCRLTLGWSASSFLESSPFVTLSVNQCVILYWTLYWPAFGLREFQILVSDIEKCCGTLTHHFFHHLILPTQMFTGDRLLLITYSQLNECQNLLCWKFVVCHNMDGSFLLVCIPDPIIYSLIFSSYGHGCGPVGCT